jgi:mannose-6-phosphate isomerase-like protein (cupin superfamily)
MDYDITLDAVYAPLEKLVVADVKKMSDHFWFNRTLCTANDAAIRLGVFNGEFHWHSHEKEDEVFLVLEGSLEIEVEGRAPFVLGPLEGVMVPKGVRHRPKAPSGATVLMIEQKTIVPTGS